MKISLFFDFECAIKANIWTIYRYCNSFEFDWFVRLHRSLYATVQSISLKIQRYRRYFALMRMLTRYWKTCHRMADIQLMHFFFYRNSQCLKTFPNFAWNVVAVLLSTNCCCQKNGSQSFIGACIASHWIECVNNWFNSNHLNESHTCVYPVCMVFCTVYWMKSIICTMHWNQRLSSRLLHLNTN